MKKLCFLAFLAVSVLHQAATAQQMQNFEMLGRFFYGDLARGPITGVCTDDRYLYLTENFDSLKIFSLADSLLPGEQVGSCHAYYIENLYKHGGHMIATGAYQWYGFTFFDISNVHSPTFIRHYGGSQVIAHPLPKGSYLYVPFWQDIADQHGLQIYDISNPDSAFMTDYCYTYWFLPFDIDLYGNWAYASDWVGNNPCKIFDVSNPYDITEVGATTSLAPGAVEVYARHLFLGPSVDLYSGPIGIFSLENPANPMLELTVNTSILNSWSLDVIDGYAFVFDGIRSRILVMDVGGFDYPESLGVFEGPPIHNCFHQIAIDGNCVYLAAGDSGLYVLRYTGPMPINTGDANNSGIVNGIDVVFMVSYLRGGPPIPEPSERGDANGDCTVNGLDVVYMVNYLKGQGPGPVRAFCYEH